MPDTDSGQTGLPNPTNIDITEPGSGFLHSAETAQAPSPDTPAQPADKAAPSPSSSAMERPGTAEHLAARRPVPKLDAETPEIKQRLAALRTDITRLLTALRWEGKSVPETAEQMIPLLNIGPIEQWKQILLPFLLEVDRAGNLLPVWLNIIDRGDPIDLPAAANPAETAEGRARRYAILMLGYYASVSPSDSTSTLGFKRQSYGAGKAKAEDIHKTLEKLILDPNTSMYAAQALVRQGTTTALQILIGALKDAEGWAKVDIVENALSLNQQRFYDIIVASGLDRVSGLESYIAIPIYRTIPLEDYLRPNSEVPVRLRQQAALIFSQIIQESINPPRGEVKTLPVIFERDLPTVATALFEGARSNPMWQNTVAVHRMGIMLGRYWLGISRSEIKDARIVEPVYRCLPMMNDVERWMAGPGRDILLATLEDANEEALMPTVKALGDLRDPRAIAPLITYIETTKELTSRSHALLVGGIIDTLGLLGDRRAIPALQQLLVRTVNSARRSNLPRRRDNLPAGDADIPGSIVYAAVMRALGQFNDRSVLDTVFQATSDYDPYVRTQALEALKRLDPSGSDTYSRQVVRKALDDPRDSIVRLACQLTVQYRDLESESALHQLAEARPDLAATVYATLHQLRQ